ncbi:fibrinogen beta chain-like isoform X2 [Ruditapes philippinarum]|uniref:fibrinogen beta chain-like isoform X2 n=1 Tax=Ruditapes philippinarum TaxID=129788 RepID=UPI00295B7FF2|nr:fibrinogen beta chain-like isoform X2 [Ruditapes philippinarum]
MNRMASKILLLLLAAALPTAQGLTCLQCRGVSQPRHCNIVDECYPGEVCGVERINNHLGQTVYDVGCIHQSKCYNSSMNQQSSISNECKECCNTDICNSQGCGTPGYPQNRGPICHFCPFHTSINMCNEIAFCEVGEVCKYSVLKEFGDTIYSSECSNKHVCQNSINHGNVIVGRDIENSRSIIHDYSLRNDRSLTEHICSGCCDVDLCFKGCNETNVSISGATDCYDIYKNDKDSKSGVYNIMLWRSNETINVYCDMDTSPPGWTVFQNRFDGSVDFYRSFSAYMHGFGNIDGEYWLGLRFIEEMTRQYESVLRIDLLSANHSHVHEIFQNFSLSNYPNFRLYLGNQTVEGIPDNKKGFIDLNGQGFTTYDHDVDRIRGENCAILTHGGWWYQQCTTANLNGQYVNPPGSISSINGGSGGFIYFDWQGVNTLKASKMMFRKQYQ